MEDRGPNTFKHLAGGGQSSGLSQNLFTQLTSRSPSIPICIYVSKAYEDLAEDEQSPRHSTPGSSHSHWCR